MVEDQQRLVPVRRRVRGVLRRPEIRGIAETIDTWWPEIEAFLRLNITNALTEGSNLAIKRAGRGFSNQSNYQRRISANATAKKAA